MLAHRPDAPNTSALRLLTILDRDTPRLERIDAYMQGRHDDPYMPAKGLATWLEIMAAKNGVVLDPDEPQMFQLGSNVGLVPGWLSWLTEDRRRQLAADELIYYLKTHELPFERYFPGERGWVKTTNPRLLALGA